MHTKQKTFAAVQKAEQRLAKVLPKDLVDIDNSFKEAGYELYLVGGAVRDALLNKDPDDFDLATNAKPDEVLNILKDYKTDLHGKAFGVVVLYTDENKDGYEIATFRTDGTGRKPIVKLGVGIEQDVMRRDLTMNALFYDISKGKIVDLVGGIEDILYGKVKTVGKPADRFEEDKLRLLRAVRFASRYGHELDNETADAISKCDLIDVSEERIVDEITRGIAQAKSVNNFITLMYKLGLLQKCFPNLSIRSKCLETKSVAMCLASFLIDNDATIGNTLVSKLKWPIEVARAVSFLLSLNTLTPSTALQTYRKWSITGLSKDDVLNFVKNIPDSGDIKLIKAFKDFEPTIKGDDLIANGFKGKEIGEQMNRLETINFQELLKKQH